MELMFGIYGRCFLAVGDILWAYFSIRIEIQKINIFSISVSIIIEMDIENFQ